MQVAVADLDLVDQVDRFLAVVVDRLLNLALEIRVLQVAVSPQTAQPDGSGEQRDIAGGLEQERPADVLEVGRDPACLFEHHFLQQVRQEEALALAREHDRRRALRPEVPAECTKNPVNRCAFLRAGREIDTAQCCIDVIAGRFENLDQEVVDRVLQRRHLRRETEGPAAFLRVRRGRQPVGKLRGQREHQLVELLGEIRHHVVGAVLRLEGRAPDDRTLRVRQVAEVIHEARDQIHLGQDHVDRERDVEAGVKLVQPFADRGGVRLLLRLALRHQVFDRNAYQHAVDRLARPVLGQHVQKAQPAFRRGVAFLDVVLGRVLARCVDQHRFFGEPTSRSAGYRRYPRSPRRRRDPPAGTSGPS